MNKTKVFLSATTILLLASNSNANKTTNLDTIVVTVQKTQELAKDVPIAMNLFDEFSIEDYKIQNIEDLANYTPGFFLNNSTDNGTASPSVRGVYSDFSTISSTVSMYIDDIPTFNTSGFNLILNDIERIEVLKGPQSTLYGKNAEAGVINIITKKPTNETKGQIAIELGEDKKRQYSLNASGPILKDKFYAGISGSYYEKDGFIENIHMNKNANDRQNYTGKLNLRYTPSDDLEISLISSKQKRDDGGGNSSKTTYSDMNKVSLDQDEANEMDNAMTALKVEYNFDNKSIETITSYKKDDLYMQEDVDKSTNQMFKYHTFVSTITKNISQEIRFKAKEDRYNYLVGVFADKNTDENNVKYDSFFGKVSYADQKIDSTNIGVFSHMDYALSDKLSILGGLRYDKDKKKFDNKLSSTTAENSFNEISPKIALKYKFNPNTMGYMNIAKGYKSGGYYMFSPAGEEFYDKESLYSYELGTKNLFLDNKLQLNSAIYYIDMKDKQVTVQNTNNFYVIKNASEATSKGIELDAIYKLNDSINLTAALSYSKVKYGAFSYSLSGNKVDNSGNIVPFTPKYTYNFGISYRGLNGIYANTSINGYGKYFIDDQNQWEQNAYRLVDAKIGYETDNYNIYLYGKNIFDKEYHQKEYFSQNYAILSKPREIGVQLVYRF